MVSIKSVDPAGDFAFLPIEYHNKQTSELQNREGGCLTLCAWGAHTTHTDYTHYAWKFTSFCLSYLRISLSKPP